jgi:O-succinylbenzoate synthase
MKIDEIILREVGMRLKGPFETSFGTICGRRIALVEVRCDGVSGWGEVTAAEGPFYNSETTDIAWIVLCNFVAPLILGKNIKTASEVMQLLEPIRGHEMAKAALETALWDVEARQKGLPLWRLLGGTRPEIACGVSLGIRHDPQELIGAVEKELKDGYQRIKIKIKPGKDLDFVSAVRKQFPKTRLMADANSAYRLADAEFLRKFDAFELMMIEQPLEWDDMYHHSKLQTLLKTPICLDECIHNPDHAEAALNMGACRIINIKLGRVGGHSHARQIEELCRSRGVPVWCGGMLETGIGRAHNIAMSTLSGFVLPGDVSASQRYWDEDLIEPEVQVTPSGTIRVPTAPGIGYTVRTKRVEQLTTRLETLRAVNSGVPVAG